MSKKNFKTSFDNFLIPDNKAKQNIKDKEIRATFIVKEVSMDKLKAVSYWERKMLKDVLEDALKDYLEKYELKNGPIQLPKPEKQS